MQYYNLYVIIKNNNIGETMKKKYILLSILCALSIALVVIALLVPCVQVVGKNNAREVLYSKPVSLITYIKDAPFLKIDGVSDVYYSSNGPIWMATTSILINILVAMAGGTALIACILGIAFAHKNASISNNVLAKKLCLFAGWFTISAGIFSIVSFILTTKLSNNYAEFNLVFGSFLTLAIGIIIIILAHLLEGRAKIQNACKVKNCIGFAFGAAFSILCGAIPFLPFFTKYLVGANYQSLFQITSNANSISSAFYPGMRADIPIGIMFYFIIAMELICAFIFIYSFIGLIRSASEKSINWLSSRVKRWSMSLMVISSIIWVLMLAQVSLFATTTTIDLGVEKFEMINWFGYVLMLAPFACYLFSALIPANKKQKLEQKENVISQDNAQF